MRRAILSVMAALALGACGGPDGLFPNGLGIAGPQGAAVQDLDLRVRLTPAVIARFDGPLMFAELPGRGVQAGLRPATRNGEVAVWITPDNVTLALVKGIVTATRGLGGDLMSSDIRDPLAAVFGQGRTRGERVHRYLDRENRTDLRSYRCEYETQPATTAETLAGVIPATLVSETCFDSRGTRFANAFWVGPDGTLRKSRQWLGPDIGYIETELLKVR